MGRMLDLDARRAEYVDEPPQVTLGGKVYTLPPKMPMVVAEYLSPPDVRVTDAIAILFGPDADEVVTLLSDEDLEAIMDDIYDMSDRVAEAQAKAPIPTSGRVAPTARTNGSKRKAVGSPA